ncbi:unnamed protein product [Brassicogethes aeneus]|uniref:Serpin domain-containing protein n=1 Tax=Brassicogethes aeneus TaxID=1431903 RepID=A0A9P0B8P3_BRAAE|nr:unnamed protein product [Brassicogethes aeneus]
MFLKGIFLAVVLVAASSSGSKSAWNPVYVPEPYPNHPQPHPGYDYGHHGYDYGHHGYDYQQPPQPPAYHYHQHHHKVHQVVPRDYMVDVVNDLGLKLLAVHNEDNDNNIALSPYGALSMLVVLGEGLAGDALHEIQHAAHLPNDISIVRVGLRDIHRHLKSYFIPKEGFLAGLTLNHDNVTLNSNYEDILKFYGFDVASFNNALYPAPMTTEKPESTTTMVTETKEMNITTMQPTTEVKMTTMQPTTEVKMTTMQPTTEVKMTTEMTATELPTTKKMEVTTLKSLAETSTEITTENSTLSADVETKNNETTTVMPESTVQSTEATTTMETTSVKESTTEAKTTTREVEETTTMMPTSTTVGTTPMTTTEGTTVSTEITAESTNLTPTETTLPNDDLIASITENILTTNFAITTIVPFDTTTTNLEYFSTQEPFIQEILPTQEPYEYPFYGDSTVAPDFYPEVDSRENLLVQNNATTLKRSARSVVDYIIAKYYDNSYDSYDHHHHKEAPGYVPEEPLTFYAHGKYRESGVNFMQYDAVLPFLYVPHLNALALSFPLDNTKYYLLLLLPLNVDGINDLICDLRLNGSLKFIIENLKLTRVKATIPSFMLKGYVVLTPTLQKLGIRKIFEPRHADFTPMTKDKETYVTNIEQAVTVTIRNYVNLDNLPNYGNLHDSDPVHFRADHPFLYFVIDADLHVALMAGKIVNPLNTRIR